MREAGALTAGEVRAALAERLGEEAVLGLLESDEEGGAVYEPAQIVLAAERIAEACLVCRDDESLRFDSLMSLGAVDNGERLAVVYHLHSMALGHKVALRVDLPRTEPSVPTAEGVWKTANWHEREAADLMGIVFEGHSDPRPILLPEDWEGHPLRKDYVVQEYYKGMKVPY